MGLEQQLFWSYADLAVIINLYILLKWRLNETLSAYGLWEKMSSFQEISEHGIFHGIIICFKNKSLKMKANNGLFTIEWE